MYSAFNNCLQQIKGCDHEPDIVSIRSTLVSVQAISCLNKVLPLLPIDIGNEALLVSAPKTSVSKRSFGSEIGNSASGDSFIGSPLELESCVDYSDVDRNLLQDGEKVRTLHKDRPSIYPLTDKQARECMSAVDLQGGIDFRRPVLYICDSTTNREHTAVLGRFRNKDCDVLLVLKYRVVAESELKSLMRSLLEECYAAQTIRSDGDDVNLSSVIPTKAKAEYHLMSTCSSILRDELSAEEINAFTSHSSITVFVEWSTVNSLLMVPPPDAIATLKLKVVCGDKSSVVYPLHEELEFLKSLVHSVRFGKTKWPEVERSSTPLELVKQLLQCPVYDVENIAESSEASAIQVNSVDPRKNLDFTDRLWSILKVCQSYNELLEVMQYIVTSVTNKTCRPLMVSSSNTNPLAKWIYSQQVGQPDSSLSLNFGGVQVLMYLIEIGLEKLTKDYIHTYLGNFGGLVTPDKLDSFTKKNFTVEDKLTNLSKLHTVLELAALLHCYLRLPLPAVRSATSSALHHLVTHSQLPEEGFKLTTTVANISDILQAQSPEVWEVLIGEESNPVQIKARLYRSEPDHSVVFSNQGESNDHTHYCSLAYLHSVDSCLM